MAKAKLLDCYAFDFHCDKCHTSRTVQSHKMSQSEIGIFKIVYQCDSCGNPEYIVFPVYRNEETQKIEGFFMAAENHVINQYKNKWLEMINEKNEIFQNIYDTKKKLKKEFFTYQSKIRSNAYEH